MSGDDIPDDVRAVLALANARFSAVEPAAAPPATAAPPGASRAPAPKRSVAELERMGVPPRKAMQICRGIDPTPAVCFAREFLAAYERGVDDAGDLGWTPPPENMLILSGGIGTGKTLAAIEVLVGARVRGVGRYRWSADELPLFLHTVEFVAMGLYEHEAERRRIKRAPVLVLDDLGKEHQDKVGISSRICHWLVNARHEAMGITVITTELSADAFAERYGAATFDRIVQAGAWYDIEGGSLRGQGR